jgi:DNA-binding response OmpR family regulator
LLDFCVYEALHMSHKVLVVDDEADVRTFISAVLKKHGYVPITAVNGAEGLLKAREEKPSLVILDLQMPQQTGTDFYRNFQKGNEFDGTPVIVVSGLPGRQLAVKKAAAVFDKPIDPDEFIAAVEKALA